MVDDLKFPKVLVNQESYGKDFKKDCVFTNPEAIVSLGKYGVLDREKTYLEPACGIGNLSMVLKRNNYNVASSDILDWGYGDIRPISSYDTQTYDVVLTNPPYSIWEEFLYYSLAIARTDVFLLMPLRYLEGQHRSRVLKVKGLSKVYVFSYRVKMYDADGTRLSGLTAYAWFHWQQYKRGGPDFQPEIHWLYR